MVQKLIRFSYFYINKHLCLFIICAANPITYIYASTCSGSETLYLEARCRVEDPVLYGCVRAYLSIASKLEWYIKWTSQIKSFYCPLMVGLKGVFESHDGMVFLLQAKLQLNCLAFYMDIIYIDIDIKIEVY